MSQWSCEQDLTYKREVQGTGDGMNLIKLEESDEDESSLQREKEILSKRLRKIEALLAVRQLRNVEDQRLDQQRQALQQQNLTHCWSNSGTTATAASAKSASVSATSASAATVPATLPRQSLHSQPLQQQLQPQLLQQLQPLQQLQLLQQLQTLQQQQGPKRKRGCNGGQQRRNWKLRQQQLRREQQQKSRPTFQNL